MRRGCEAGAQITVPMPTRLPRAWLDARIASAGGRAAAQGAQESPESRTYHDVPPDRHIGD